MHNKVRLAKQGLGLTSSRVRPLNRLTASSVSQYQPTVRSRDLVFYPKNALNNRMVVAIGYAHRPNLGLSRELRVSVRTRFSSGPAKLISWIPKL